MGAKPVTGQHRPAASLTALSNLSPGVEGTHARGHSPASSVGQSPGCWFIMDLLVCLGVIVGLSSFEKRCDETQGGDGWIFLDRYSVGFSESA